MIAPATAIETPNVPFSMVDFMGDNSGLNYHVSFCLASTHSLSSGAVHFLIGYLWMRARSYLTENAMR